MAILDICPANTKVHSFDCQIQGTGLLLGFTTGDGDVKTAICRYVKIGPSPSLRPTMMTTKYKRTVANDFRFDGGMIANHTYTQPDITLIPHASNFDLSGRNAMLTNGIRQAMSRHLI